MSIFKSHHSIDFLNLNTCALAQQNERLTCDTYQVLRTDRRHVPGGARMRRCVLAMIRFSGRFR